MIGEDVVTGNNPHDRGDTRPVGVVLTIRDIHDTVTSIDQKMDDNYGKMNEELTKIKVQLAAHAVIIGIVTAGIITIVGKVF